MAVAHLAEIAPMAIAFSLHNSTGLKARAAVQCTIALGVFLHPLQTSGSMPAVKSYAYEKAAFAPFQSSLQMSYFRRALCNHIQTCKLLGASACAYSSCHVHSAFKRASG
eukprot:scaffold85075_cov17-Tisochrysis_lutea.AAC.3